MGNSVSINKINFEDVQEAIKKDYIIINTLPSSNQKCLIDNTRLYRSDKGKYVAIFWKNGESYNTIRREFNR